MYPVFESIRKDENGVHQWPYHAERIQRTSLQLWNHEINLDKIEDALAQIQTTTCLKCKLLYNAISFHLETSTYQPRLINQLILLERNDLDYSMKYTDRSCFQPPFAINDETDFLYTKHGVLTDSSYANIALWNGSEWHTPDTPLLQGSQRAFLLHQNKLIEKRIDINSLGSYQKISLINAMLPLGQVEIDIKNVIQQFPAL